MAILVALLPFVSAGKPAFLLSRISLVIFIISWLIEVVISKKINWREVINNPLMISFLFLYLFDLIGIAYSSNRLAAFNVVEKQLPLLIFPLAILTSNSLSKIRTEMLFWIFVFSVTMACTFCIGYAFHRNNYWEFFSNPNWFYFSYSDLTEVIGIQAIYLSLYVEFAFFIGLVYLLENWSQRVLKTRILIILLIGYLYFVLFLLAGKMSIISATAGATMILLYFFYRAKMVGYGLIGILMFIVVSFLIVTQLPVVKERFISFLGMQRTSSWVYGDPAHDRPSPDVRLVKWKASLNLISENWLIGVGPGDVQNQLNKEYEKLDFQLGIRENFNPHNQFLQTWLSTGLFGLVALLATLFIALKRAFSKNDLLLFILNFILVANCLTESILERQYGIFFYSIFLCLNYRFHVFVKVSSPSVVEINP